MDTPPDVSVIFPAWNEAENVRETLDRSLASLRSQFNSFEIIIVDDHSTDGTPEILEEYRRRNPEIVVLRNPQNQGCGATVWRGLRYANGKAVVHNAMDYPLDLDDLRLMVPQLETSDIVVAVRKSRPGYSSYRLLTSRVNLWLLRRLFEPRLRDYNFTQVYRREVLQALEVDTRSTAFLTPELLIRAHSTGYRISEVEIDYYPRLRGTATSGKPRAVARSVRDLFRFWFRMRLTGNGRVGTRSSA